MTFLFVSGMGTDSSERSRVMWARVKGRTENALLRLPFKAAYMFRRAHRRYGIRRGPRGRGSCTRWRGLHPALKAPAEPRHDDGAIGTRHDRRRPNGFNKPVLETSDINGVRRGEVVDPEAA
jgi:hypothetical protein